MIDMEREFPVLKWGGRDVGAVLGCWTQSDAVLESVWRLVLDGGKTLVVDPYQSKSCPAASIERLGIPIRLDPILGGLNGSGDFSKALREVANALTNKTWDRLRAVLENHGVSDLTETQLTQLCNFIIREVAPHAMPDTWEELLDTDRALGGNALSLVVEKVEGLTGVDITENLMQSCWPGMVVHLEEWVRDTANDFPFGEPEARKNLIDRVRWVANFGDKKMWLVRSIKEVRHSKEDAELCEVAKPTEQERATVDLDVVTAKIRAEGGMFNNSGKRISHTCYDLVGEAWQIRVALRMSPDTWKTTKDTIEPVDKSSRNHKWDLHDFIDDPTKGYNIMISEEELRLVFSYNSSERLIADHPQMKVKVDGVKSK